MHFVPTEKLFVVSSKYYHFYIGGSAMEFVRQYSQSGHILSDDFDDASDINRGRVKLISQINSVLCYFRKVHCFVYGCVFSPHTVTVYMDVYCGILYSLI